MSHKKFFLFLSSLLILLVLVGCGAKAAPKEAEYQYTPLDETLGLDAYEAIEKICSAEDAQLLSEDFYDEARLWQCTAHKEVYAAKDKEYLTASITMNLCEYKGYMAVYSVLNYGFTDSEDIWQPVSEQFINIQNSETVGKAPDVTFGVTVIQQQGDKGIPIVCTFYPDASKC